MVTNLWPRDGCCFSATMTREGNYQPYLYAWGVGKSVVAWPKVESYDIPPGLVNQGYKVMPTAMSRLRDITIHNRYIDTDTLAIRLTYRHIIDIIATSINSYIYHSHRLHAESQRIHPELSSIHHFHFLGKHHLAPCHQGSFLRESSLERLRGEIQRSAEAVGTIVGTPLVMNHWSVLAERFGARGILKSLTRAS